METIAKERQDTEMLASDILIAILVNIKKLSGQEQLFMRVNYHSLHTIFWSVRTGFETFFEKYFIFSDSGPFPFSPPLQEAIEQLQLAGMICWPDVQEPDAMRLNLNAENWYYEILMGSGPQSLSRQDVIIVQQIAEKIIKVFSPLIVTRPYLMNH